MKWAATSVRPTTAPIGQMCQPNCNDQIAARSFGATIHISPLEFDILNQYDAIFATMSKVRESFEPRWMDVMHRLKDAGKIVVLFQEAETGWPMGRSWEEIQSFLELLKKVDLFLTHNQRDVNMWGTMTAYSRRWRTCLDLSIPMSPKYWKPIAWTAESDGRQNPRGKEKIDPGTRPILFGSSYDARANGITGLLACRTFQAEGYPLWHQNRSTGYADRNVGLPQELGVRIDREIPHSGWGQWLDAISGAYVAIHMMPAAAAGRDQIAFAALGIPCVGNPELDIQRELFPDLCVADLYDPQAVRARVEKLLLDRDFYLACRNRAQDQIYNYGLQSADAQAEEIKKALGWA